MPLDGWLCVDEAVRGLQHDREVVEGDGNLRMVAAKTDLPISQRATDSQLFLCEAAIPLSDACKIVELNSNIGMIRAKTAFKNRQRAAHQRLCLGKAVGGL